LTVKREKYTKGTIIRKTMSATEKMYIRNLFRERSGLSKGKVVSTTIGKTYTFHNFPLTVWYLMKAALGREGSGAGTAY